jgi:hypothetical protein
MLCRSLLLSGIMLLRFVCVCPADPNSNPKPYII